MPGRSLPALLHGAQSWRRDWCALTSSVGSGGWLIRERLCVGRSLRPYLPAFRPCGTARGFPARPGCCRSFSRRRFPCSRSPRRAARLRLRGPHGVQAFLDVLGLALLSSVYVGLSPRGTVALLRRSQTETANAARSLRVAISVSVEACTDGCGCPVTRAGGRQGRGSASAAIILELGHAISGAVLAGGVQPRARSVPRCCDLDRNACVA